MTHWFRLIAVLFVVAAATPLRAAEPLVSAAWVKENYAAEGVVFLDARHVSSFRQAAIPGAVNTNYGKDGWRIKKGKLPGMLPPVDRLEKLIGRLGISNSDHVVVVAGGYGASEMGVATRIYWTFKVLGHDQVSILDGGMEAYFELGKVPLSRNIPRPKQKTFKAAPKWDLVATGEDVAAAKAAGVALIDSRPNDQFLGVNKSSSVKRHGTLAGARNLPGKWLTVDDGGFFRRPDVLKKLFAAAGVKPDQPAIAFCNTGHWASLGWFVSRELMGNDQVKLYDGSMAQWTQKPENPVERAIQLD